MKILFCGTHPNLNTGYANVVFNLIKHVNKQSNEIILFAFDAHAVTLDRAHELNIKIISPFRINGQPFGESILASVVDSNQPDVIIIYNDISIVSRLLNSIDKCTFKSSKIIVYLDMVYEYQQFDLLQFITTKAHNILCFSTFWQQHLQSLFPQYQHKINVLAHGIRNDQIYPINQNVDKIKNALGLPTDGLIILNLNRNSWRKRWDITIRSFIQFIKNNIIDQKIIKTKVYLFIGCELKQFNSGVTYSIFDVIKTECLIQKINIDSVMQFFIFKGNKKFSDKEINQLYNCCDIGINTCGGEGFGLCNFEHGFVGKPQIVSWVGGLKECLEGAYYIKPTNFQYAVDSLGGILYDFDYHDFANAIKHYYDNPDLIYLDGTKIRSNITNNPEYDWKSIAIKFEQFIAASVEKVDFTETKENVLYLKGSKIKNLKITS